MPHEGALAGLCFNLMYALWSAQAQGSASLESGLGFQSMPSVPAQVWRVLPAEHRHWSWA